MASMAAACTVIRTTDLQCATIQLLPAGSPAVQLHHVDLHVHLIRTTLEFLRIFGMPPCYLFQLTWGRFAAQGFVYYLLIHYLAIKLYTGFIAFSF